MLDLPPPFADDHANSELAAAVRDTLTVSKIARTGRAHGSDGLRVTLRPLPAGAAAPARTGISDRPSVTLTFTASRQDPTAV